MKRGKNKNLRKEIKDWLVAIGFCMGLLLMGGQVDDLRFIWVNAVGFGILIISLIAGGAFKKENC